MLRLLMIVSGAFEALFGIAAILATTSVTDALGTGADPAALFFACCAAHRAIESLSFWRIAALSFTVFSTASDHSTFWPPARAQ